MIVRPFKIDDIFEMDMQESQKVDMDGETPESLNVVFTENVSYAITVLDEGEILACVACVEVGDNEAVLCSYISKLAGSCMLRLTRFLIAMLRQLEYKKIEVYFPHKFNKKQDTRWAKILGFTIEHRGDDLVVGVK